MSEIRGVGVDLCAVSRMEEQLEKEHFLCRCFTQQEIEYIRSRGRAGSASMAGIFAAKEAVCKALGTGIAFALTDIEVQHTPSGQPVIHLSGRAAELAENGSMQLSISHEGDMAAAFVVWTVISEKMS